MDWSVWRIVTYLITNSLNVFIVIASLTTQISTYVYNSLDTSLPTTPLSSSHLIIMAQLITLTLSRQRNHRCLCSRHFQDNMVFLKSNSVCSQAEYNRLTKFLKSECLFHTPKVRWSNDTTTRYSAQTSPLSNLWMRNRGTYGYFY